MLCLCHPSVPLRWTTTCNLCASTSMPIIARITQFMASIDCTSYRLVGLCSVVIGHNVLTWHCLQPLCLAWCGSESMTKFAANLSYYPSTYFSYSVIHTVFCLCMCICTYMCTYMCNKFPYLLSLCSSDGFKGPSFQATNSCHVWGPAWPPCWSLSQTAGPVHAKGGENEQDVPEAVHRVSDIQHRVYV